MSAISVLTATTPIRLLLMKIVARRTRTLIHCKEGKRHRNHYRMFLRLKIINTQTVHGMLPTIRFTDVIDFVLRFLGVIQTENSQVNQ